jgi:hypothetical protein
VFICRGDVYKGLGCAHGPCLVNAGDKQYLVKFFVDVIVCLDACPFSNQRLYSMTAEADAKRAIVRKLVEEFKDEGWDKAWSVCTIHDRTA